MMIKILLFIGLVSLVLANESSSPDVPTDKAATPLGVEVGPLPGLQAAAERPPRTPRPPRSTRRPRPSRGPSRIPSRDFTSYLLSLQWPPAFRKDSPRIFNEAAKTNLEEWTILGLLPDETSRCRSDQRFNISQLASQLVELGSKWPSFTKLRTTEAFWRLQWNRHGACSNLTVPQYFAKALELYDDLPVGQWLAEAQVVPSATVSYSVNDFTRAFNGKIGPNQFVLKCKDVLNGGAKHLLKELSICVAKDGVSLTDCKKKHSCKDTFFYLSASASGRKDS